MSTFSIDSYADKIDISVLCRLLVRKGILTHADFEEVVLRSRLFHVIEDCPAAELGKLERMMMEVSDPENKTG